MDYSIAHGYDMNWIGKQHYADGRVPWMKAECPLLSRLGLVASSRGRLRHCAYCGSMHPADVAAAIRAGATGSWADFKYGWPHKAYFDGVPNPHKGALEILGRANTPQTAAGWKKVPFKRQWIFVERAPARTHGKFYAVHLKDATPEERAIIEAHLGMSFQFTDDGTVGWKRI